MGTIHLFKLFGVWVDAHHILLAVSMALCLGLSLRALCKEGVQKQQLCLFAGLSLLLGFFCAHLFYCLMNFSSTIHDHSWLSFLQFWAGNGQYMLYGGAVGVALALLISAGHASFAKLADAIAPFGLLMIALCRVAQGLAGEGYGDYLEEESPLAFFPLAVFDDYYEEWAWALFLLAAVVALIFFVWVLKTRSRFAGDKALLALGLYASAQIILETLRRDQFLRWGFVRCSQLFSAIAVLGVLALYCHKAKEAGWPKRLPLLIGFLLAVAVCFVMEFAAEQRIAALIFLSRTACYWVSACGCCIIALCILCMRRLCPKEEK